MNEKAQIQKFLEKHKDSPFKGLDAYIPHCDSEECVAMGYYAGISNDELKVINALLEEFPGWKIHRINQDSSSTIIIFHKR